MIRFAARRDHPQLKALWAEAFGDRPEDIALYFALRHADENMLVEERDHVAAGMLSMLPVTLCGADGSRYRARYLYAVATGKRYRGQGISTALLEAAHIHMKVLGEAAAILVPASADLFAFYARRGYTPAFSLDILTLDAADLLPLPPQGRLQACSAAEYARIRNRAFQHSALYVCWEESAVAYTLQTLSGSAVISWQGGHGCAAWDVMDTRVLVRELALPQGGVQAALAVLHQTLRAPRYTVRLAQGTLPGTAPQPFGMIHWLIPQPTLTGAPPYLSLAMD